MSLKGGPPPLPIFGNILQLNLKLPEKTFLEWKRRYGDVFTIWIPDPVVVLASNELQTEYFGRPGETFAGRPQSMIMKLLFKGNWGLILDDNEVYKNQRRFALHALKDHGFARPEFEPFIVGEALRAIERSLEEQETSGECDIKSCFTMCSGNIINQLVFGHTTDDKEKLVMLKTTLQELFSEWFHPRWLLLEALPWLRHLERIGIGYGIGRASKINNRFLSFLQDEIAEHQRSFDPHLPPRDFADAFLLEMSKLPGGEETKEFNMWQLTIACYDLWSAALETTVCTLQHAVLFLLQNPEIQEKIHGEIYDAIGTEQHLTSKDQFRLPYLSAFIQEVHRLTNVIPLSLPHETLDDTTIEGYHIPKGTAVMAQLACVNLDPDEYEEPEKCLPERHIDPTTGKLRREDRLHPFSIGRRACLGEGLARPEMFIVLGTLLQKCRVVPVEEGKPPTIEPSPGLVKSVRPFMCKLEKLG
uniref:AN1-type domain-containing protein n=1 Tax=Steinernema glaseri TaxID=37863 RepID=A0A1I8AJ18_9BILA